MEVLTLESKLRPYGLVLTHHVWQHLTRRPFPRLKNCALPSNCVTQPRHCPPFTRLTQRSMTQLPLSAFSRSISGKYDPSCKQPGGQTMAMGEARREERWEERWEAKREARRGGSREVRKEEMRVAKMVVRVATTTGALLGMAFRTASFFGLSSCCFPKHGCECGCRIAEHKHS